MAKIDVSDPHSAPSPMLLWRQIAAVLIPTFVLVLSSSALPPIALDTPFARLATRVSDTASWTQMPLLCIAAVILLTSRPGPEMRRRAVEAATILLVMIAAIAGNAKLNEDLIKPAFHVPRPNIVALAERGALGPEVPDGPSFYAIGDKQERREYLAVQLVDLEEPALGPEVRAHWIHETGFSFPSGHSTASMTMASLMLALGLSWLRGWRQSITTALSIWALLVVYSRVLLQVHSFADVTVGTLVGFCWGLLSFVVVREIVERLAPDDI